MHWYRGRLVWVLLGTVLVLLIVAAIAWALYTMLRQPPAPTPAWLDPISAVVPDDIAPDLALYPLAGASVSETIDAAIASSELETAYALLAYSQGLSDAERLGRLIRLGDRFAEAGLPQRATVCYQQVFDEAILTPRLSESVREDALLSTGRGWMVLGDASEAQKSYDQAFLIAVQGAYLHDAYRRELLGELASAYRELGDPEQADACLEGIDELDREPGSYSPPLTTDWPSVPTGEELISSPEVGVLEEARRQAAYALLQAASSEGEPPADLVSRLAQALLQEDAAKLKLYSEELQATTQAGRRSDIQIQTIRWLLVKYQVASGGLGLAVVPEWDTKVAEIRSALSKAFEDLLVEYGDFVAALPQAAQMDPVRYEVLRRLSVAGRRGLYPDYPAERMAQELVTAARAVIESGPEDRLYVEPLWEGGGLEFVFSPAEQYGQPAGIP